REAGNIAAGPREALHPTDADQIAYPRNDGRDGARELHQYRDHPAAAGEDGVWIRRDQTCRLSPYQFHIVRGPTLIKLHICAVRFPSSRRNARTRISNFGIAFGVRHQNRHAPHALALPRTRCERPCCRAANQRDELAAVAHSITSSDSASSLSGISRPSAFAVWRLITHSNFVGCSTGKSAGL